MIFETERLIIREFGNEDIDLIYDINNDPECIRFNGWDSMSYEECQEVLRKWKEQYLILPGTGIFCVEGKVENNKVGMTFIIKTKTCGVFEIGFRFRRVEWNKGYAKEITRKLLEYSRENLNAISLMAEVYTENIRSRNVFEKLGFKETKHPDGENGLIYRFDIVTD